jgi:hypothetical protein
MAPYTEYTIQKSLMSYYLSVQCIAVPNTKALWKRQESDLVILTPCRVVHEFEIKLTRADFKSDFKKISKHKRLTNKTCPVNKFSYVCPEGLITKDMIPQYSGLIYIKNKDLKPYTIKKAPHLNTKPLSDKTKDRMFRSLAWKYCK